MEASTALRLPLAGRLDRFRADARPAGAWLLSFALVSYLAFSDGGFDTVSRGQAGVAVWWVVLLGAAIGVLPRNLGRVGWVAVGLMFGFAVWTGLSIAWSISAERSADELGRIATYAGVLLLAVSTVRFSGARPALYGAATAVGVVGLLAVLSRLHPGWFPVNQQLVFFQNARRLSYPINYWNGLAAFLAMGVPLMLAVAADATRLTIKAIAAAAVPVLALGMFFTVSRGGVIALGVGLVAYFLLTHDRLAGLATLAVCGAGSAILIAYADARPALQTGATNSAAVGAGNHMLPVLVIVAVGVGLLQVAIGLAARHAARPRLLEPPRREGALRWAAVVGVLVIVAIAAGVPGKLNHAWNDFKRPPGAVNAPSNSADLFGRLQSAAGNDRYQYWQVAAHAARQHPGLGEGAGTFELLWTPRANVYGHIEDAHSLYMQTVAETGFPGLLLIVGLLLAFVVVGAVRAFRGPPERRLLLAGATAGVLVFCTEAAYDWVWQLGAVTTLMLILGAICLTDRPGASRPDAERQSPRGGLALRLSGRVGLAIVALGAIVAISLPMAEAQDLASSQAAASHGQLRTALADAKSAERVQPYAASAHLQEALVRERLGDLAGARTAAMAAINDEPANWQGWVVLARIQSELGNGHAALADFARARALDPQGNLFQ